VPEVNVEGVFVKRRDTITCISASTVRGIGINIVRQMLIAVHTKAQVSCSNVNMGMPCRVIGVHYKGQRINRLRFCIGPHRGWESQSCDYVIATV